MIEFTEKQFREILEIGILLVMEKNHNRLFELIVENAMDITHCDGGTLYLAYDNQLEFKIMRTVSLNIYRGGDGKVIDLPPVPMREENVCAYSGIHRETINIADVYYSDKFDFSGPKKYDSITGFRTQSMLVIPLENHEHELIGVLQLMNAMDKENNVVPFDPAFEKIILSLASQTAIAISNMRYLQEIKELLYSFVEAMAVVIDQRTPYNANHTKNVAMYTAGFVDFINREHEAGRCQIHMDSNQKEQLVLAAGLHDIGKMNVPLSVMNKATRLGPHVEEVVSRFEQLRSYYKIDYYENRISKEACEEECRYLTESEAFVVKLDKLSFLEEEAEAKVMELAAHVYQKPNGDKIQYLTEYEKECLLIQRGTLTVEERKIMQGHVDMTSRILANIRFNHSYKDVPFWAGSHHELLDGSGYPNHLGADETPMEVRILVLADIFDALTARDRPYKKAMPMHQALEVLHSMVDEGKLDRVLTDLFHRYADEELTKYTIQ